MKRLVKNLVCLCGALLLIACNKEGDTQLAAKVEGNELTVHQINFLLGRTNQQTDKLTPEQQKVLANKVLDSLIDEEIVVQRAIQDKVDRAPAVVQTIEAAKRQILMQSYLAEQYKSLSKPTKTEIDAYYRAHPALFAERKIYWLNILNIRPNPTQALGLQAKIAAGADLKMLAEWLVAEKIPFRAAQATAEPAEQLPLGILEKIYQQAEGKIVSISGKEGVDVMQIVQARPQPVTPEQSALAIERKLTADKQAEWTKTQMKNWRTQAKIEYANGYAAPRTEITNAASAAAASVSPASAVQEVLGAGMGALK